MMIEKHMLENNRVHGDIRSNGIFISEEGNFELTCRSGEVCRHQLSGVHAELLLQNDARNLQVPSITRTAEMSQRQSLCSQSRHPIDRGVGDRDLAPHHGNPEFRGGDLQLEEQHDRRERVENPAGPGERELQPPLLRTGVQVFEFQPGKEAKSIPDSNIPFSKEAGSLDSSQYSNN